MVSQFLQYQVYEKESSELFEKFEIKKFYEYIKIDERSVKLISKNDIQRLKGFGKF